MTLTRRETHALRRVEKGKTPGTGFIFQILLKKGFVSAPDDGSLPVTTPKGREMLTKREAELKRKQAERAAA